jgi:hypothetical protein
MALAIVQRVGNKGASPLTTSISTAAGNLIVVIVATSSTVFSAGGDISDTSSQSYSNAVTVTGVAGRTGSIAYFANSAALSSVTITESGATLYVTILEVSGAATSSVLDQVASHSNTYSNFTLTAGGANTTANSLVVAGVFHYYPPVSTTDGTYTTETDQVTAGVGGERTFDKIVTSTETSSIAITASGYGDTGALATFKAGSGGAVSYAVTQVHATLTLTGGTQAVSAAAIVSATISQSAATLTLTGGSQVVTTQSPPTVALNTPTNTATGVSINPVLNFTGTDPEGNDMVYELQLDTTNTFTSPLIDANSSTNVGFST